MKSSLLILIFLGFVSCNVGDNKEPAAMADHGANTLRLYPENPRYLEYMGDPIILITSGEHYGAVVNLDFDYYIYLETLEKEGFNYTRIFSGTYIEPSDNIFGIQKNTLAPEPGRFIAPWATQGGQYDLNSFNPGYFVRLKDFIEVAAHRGIIVELTLFTSIYAENAWNLSPFNPKNNIQPLEDLDFHLVNTLHNGELREYQELFIRKVVRELAEFDNVFYEIQNEPWADNPNLVNFVNLDDQQVFTQNWQKRVELANGVSKAWQEWVVTIIQDEESENPKKHLVAQNISNFVHGQERLPGGVSLINFHYALPDAAILNRETGGVTGLDETGFMPHEDMLYINQAWRFILAGGGLYNNLDYSFVAGNEDGSWPIPDSNPGWGGPDFRRMLSYLVKFLDKVPFHEMEYSDGILTSSDEQVRQYGLQKPGLSYLVFLEGGNQSATVPDVPDGVYHITWLNVESGEMKEIQQSLDGETTIASPFDKDQVVVLLQNNELKTN